MAFNRVGTQILNHLPGDFIKLGASYVNPFVYSDRIPKISVVQMSLMCTRHYTASPWSNVSPLCMDNWRIFVGGGVPTCRSRYAYFVATQSRTCVVAYRCIDCASTCISNDMSREAKEHFGLIPFPTTTEKLSIPWQCKEWPPAAGDRTLNKPGFIAMLILVVELFWWRTSVYSLLLSLKIILKLR